MNPRTVLIVLAAALALLSALLLRKPGVAEASRDAAAPRPGAAVTENSGDAAPSAVAASKPEVPAAVALHGLRLLSREDAEARGWAAPVVVKSPAQILGEATWKKWAETPITVNLTDAPLPELLTDLLQRYGLVAKFDADEVDLESHLVTFKVDELAADQAMDLILKMADLGWYVDASGILWVTSKEHAQEIAEARAPVISKSMKFTASLVRGSGRDTTKDPSMSQRRAAWMKDRKVSVSIVNKPLREAVEDLAKAGELDIYAWSEEAQKAVEKAPIASVIGEDLPLESTLDGLLAPAGLGLNLWGSGSGQVETLEEIRSWEDFEKQMEQSAKDEAKERAVLAARRVKIEGNVLTLKAVAAQLEAQLGERVVVMPDIENCASAWEADGLEQSAGEVLDILGRDAPLDWGWRPELDPDDLKDGPRLIWLVNRS